MDATPAETAEITVPEPSHHGCAARWTPSGSVFLAIAGANLVLVLGVYLGYST